MTNDKERYVEGIRLFSLGLYVLLQKIDGNMKLILQTI